MAKKIIILEKDPNPAEVKFQYLFWLDVPTERQAFYANSELTSSYQNVSSFELDDLRAGKVVEVIGDMVFPKNATFAEIKNNLIVKFNQEQIKVNEFNKWNYYGTNWDGVTWTVAGVS